MSIHGDEAYNNFMKGYNCAQSVALAYAEEMHLTPEQALTMSAGFGGGVGRLREVCGAFSGIVLVLGALYGSPDPSQKTALYTEVQALAERYRTENGGGSIVCERVNVGKSIDLTAKNGDITGSVLGGMDDFSISCTYKKGDCNLPESKPGGTKSFTANCNNGNIDIEFVK